DSISGDLVRIQASLNSDFSAFNAELLAFGKQGIEFLQKTQAIKPSNIKMARDFFLSSFKFKPWGAVNLAKNLDRSLPYIGLAFTLADAYNTYQKQARFQEAKNKIKSDLEEQRRELLTLIDGDEFSEKFFPGYHELISTIDKLKLELDDVRLKRDLFYGWKAKMEAIDVEFEEL
ncbi:hypothetical protein HF668_03385, partial [Acidithiobacillus ferridurans]|uniref:LeoA/HP0731 family dynamin-like GTPase n=1 Tax=Acidithiobacillus ferridurans TaxID=1232575 RepID=UPI001C066806